MEQEWRCTRCGKLLAVLRGDRVHIRFARGHEYLVGFPVTGLCRSCKTLNELHHDEAVAVPDQDSAK